MILILMVEGARAVISFCILSAIPGYMVVPPDMTELEVVSWIPQASIPRKEGWKRASGHLNLSLPMVMPDRREARRTSPGRWKQRRWTS